MTSAYRSTKQRLSARLYLLLILFLLLFVFLIVPNQHARAGTFKIESAQPTQTPTLETPAGLSGLSIHRLHFPLVLKAFSANATATRTPTVTRTPTKTSTIVPTPTATGTYHVDAVYGSNTTGNGSSGAPWKTITYALSHVSGPNAEIHVASGIYDEPLGESFPLLMEPGVSLIGADYSTTVIAGSSSAQNPDYSLLYFLSTEAYTVTTVVSGFTIANGSQGIRMDGSPTGSGATIEGNWITSNFLGIKSYNTSGRQSYLVIKNNLISNNQYGVHAEATGNGSLDQSLLENNLIEANTQAGIFCFSYVTSEPRSACSPTIKENVIRGNGESGIVCAIAWIGYCKPFIIGNVIANNQSWGIREENNSGCCGGTGNADALFINNFIFGNGSGGAFFKDDETPTFINNTIVNNHTYGIWAETVSDAKVINSIVWGQDDNLLVGVGNVSYSDIGDGGYAGINNNVAVNPKFVDAAHSDYHLLPTSPLLNAGNSAAANLPGMDIDFDPRILGSAVEIGADETLPPYQVSLSKSVTPMGLVLPLDLVTYTLTLTNLSSGSANGVVITDTLPANTVWGGYVVSDWGNATVNNGELTWLGTGLVGYPLTIIYNVIINANTPGGTLITNTALVDDGTGNIAETEPATVLVGSP